MSETASDLPKNHNPIHADWTFRGGGIRAFAYTTDEGNPCLAIGSFDRKERVLTPMKLIYRHQHEDTALLRDRFNIFKVPYAVSVSPAGLMLCVEPPLELAATENTIRAHWTDNQPKQPLPTASIHYLRPALKL